MRLFSQMTLPTLAALAVTWALTSEAHAQSVPCSSPADYPCDFEIGSVGVAKVPPVFKFQSRVSQAKLPIGEGTFNVVYAKLLNASGTELCREEFRDITVRDSVLNLEIGHNMNCELEDMIAREQNLAFQICLGSAQNCLKSVSLAASPLAVKSTFSVLSEKAHQADFAGQAHYAHRVTADRNLLTSSTLGFGYFDFYTHTAADASEIYPGSFAADYEQYAAGGFIQWAPVQSPNSDSIHIVGKDHATDKLGWLNDVVVFSNSTKVMGDLTVNERGLQDIGVFVTGDSRIVGTCPNASGGCSADRLRPTLEVVGQVLMGYDPTALNGFADHRTHGLHGDLQIIGDTSNGEAALAVTGQVLFGYDLARLRGDTDGATHGFDGDVEILGDPANIQPALQVSGQLLVGHSLAGLIGQVNGVTHGIDGDLQIRGNTASPQAELEVTGRVLAGADPTSLDGYTDHVSSGIDSPLQVTGAVTVNEGGVTVDEGGVIVNAGGLHVFGFATESQIHGDTTMFGDVTVAANGHVSIPTGRLETFGGLWLSDNTAAFAPAMISGGDVANPLLLVNPNNRFTQTRVTGPVVFKGQVVFEVPPAISSVSPAITAGPGIFIDDDPLDDSSKRISVDASALDTLHSRIVLNNQPISILNVSRTGGFTEVTTVTAHALTGASVVDVDASDNNFDASMVAGITVISDTRFRFAQSGPTVAQKPDAGRIVAKPEALSMANAAVGAPPTLLINGKQQFTQTRILGSTVLDGGASVTGDLHVTGTISGSCRPGTSRVGTWCIDNASSTSTDPSQAVASCSARGMQLCSAEAMLHCKYHTASTTCGTSMNATTGLVLTSSVVADGTAVTIEDRFGVWDATALSGAGNLVSAKTAQLPPNQAVFYCCSSATPGQ